MSNVQCSKLAYKRGSRPLLRKLSDMEKSGAGNKLKHDMWIVMVRWEGIKTEEQQSTIELLNWN